MATCICSFACVRSLSSFKNIIKLESKSDNTSRYVTPVGVIIRHKKKKIFINIFNDCMSKNYKWASANAIIGGSRGGACPAHAPPYRTQFFHFRIHFHWKVPTLEAKTSQNGSTPPPYGKSWIRPWLFVTQGACVIIISYDIKLFDPVVCHFTSWS